MHIRHRDRSELARARFCWTERLVMIEIKKILFPTDFSEYSNHALKYAVALAESFTAKLVVLHVCEHPIAGSGIEAYHRGPERVVDREQREEGARRLGNELREGMWTPSLFSPSAGRIGIVKAAKQREWMSSPWLRTEARVSATVFGSTA
jgi:hypothetical protein